MIKETLACGPLQSVEKEKVDGTYIGLFSKTRVDQGWTYHLAPKVDANGKQAYYKYVRLVNGDINIVGHQPVLVYAVIGISGARNFALGGGGGNGDWGQGGVGASSSMQRLVSEIQLRDCSIGIIKFQPEVVEVPVEVLVEVPVKKQRQ